MKLLLLLALLAVVAFGFRPIPMGTMVQKRLMQLSAMDIVGRDISVTDPLRNRVQGKIGKVMDKLGRDVISTNVVLRVHRFPDTEVHAKTTKKDSQIAEVTVNMKGGAAVHVEERTEDMYASIDLLSHKLAKALRRHNEKVTDSYHKGNSKDMTVDVVDDFDEEELLVDLAEEYRR